MLIADENGLFDWPNCQVPDCPNLCCRRLNSVFCWPHTVNGVNSPCHPTKEQIEAIPENERAYFTR